jgi:hypothetical protein
MNPTDFPEATGTLGGGPAAKYGTSDDVADLPVCRSGGVVISCWALSWRDRLRVLVTGRVWLCVLGDNHAPVKLTAEAPFEGVP